MVMLTSRLNAALLLALALVLVGAAALSWRAWRDGFYMGQLPSAIEVEGVESHHIQEGWLEGCGVVIFAMTPAMAQALEQRGGGALAGASQGRGGWLAPHVTYGGWQATPYKEHNPDGTALEDRWLSGLSCARLPTEAARAIDAALAQPGAYVATSHQGGLIVIPSKRLVILSLMG